MTTTPKRTVKHVGYGPSGTAAYVVLDARGKYVYHKGQFLLTHEQALQLAAEAK